MKEFIQNTVLFQNNFNLLQCSTQTNSKNYDIIINDSQALIKNSESQIKMGKQISDI